MNTPLPDQDPRKRNEKPDRRGPVGLMWYGILTIIGAIALVVVAD